MTHPAQQSSSQNNHTTTNSSSNPAIAMACTAGDKIKASAREFLRNLEAWKQQEEMPSTLDAAIQKMFGSCTMGAEALEGNEQDLDENASPRLPGRTLSGKVNSSNKNNNNGEHIYEQLFQDDQRQQPPLPTRSTNLHEQKRPKEVTPDSTKHVKIGRRGFSITSPKSSSKKKITPLKSDHLIVPDDVDDTISAISAYTLEAMEHAHRTRSHKTEISHDDSTLFSVKDELSPIKPRMALSPVGRNRSQASKLSKTTHTTEDSSFEQRFADDEKHYWTAMGGSPLHGKSSRNIATSSSSSSHSFAHPHDTIPFEPGDLLPTMVEHDDHISVFANDPDRLAMVLPVNLDTEMAEI
eukprot:CAMPEP_0168743602 /NCGR_PEP_ID=MMETSP0724-20121128/13661_1 /TAXON_ID=265536 /ORGANISM="Amphiprora sp., Strain CCMP467" /LENGTH=352 /DNA_ID=CAMNT_0008791237 /DNA_START=142 /DNA_END=1200 /DNA_ORIENTATION=+